ncbi:hypothetical protein MNEG_9914 [Monoraphidium neglectum]|uniref:Uncharacterized protein n=1 Tax=Monoraphidium neglectum TaxID=145388 RepID=A0A0D2MAX3_9CHLO|nr:hypothetical protein MNEG_9914 [Monoraphidium neglectum]KIY98051.1 hypothetical protein MNEG_9914 [Monoraphidium neglectum]|eukprot:XP_013897071.1 hypothetical protein MNEG_9914 [Monoraphidium neglectum]
MQLRALAWGSPRAPAVLPVFQKVNGHLTDPATGHRLRGRGAGAGRGRKGPVSRVSFGTFLLVAVIGWRAFRILGHAWFGGKKQQRGQGEGEEGALVEWASDADEDEEEQQLPPLAPTWRVSPELCPQRRRRALILNAALMAR